MPRTSRYVLVVDDVSSVTSSRDIEKEFSYCGRVRDVIRDAKYRCALVEFEKSVDAQYAWKKMDGFRMDGRTWKVDWASKDDFKFFGWKWFEYTPDRSRSRSRGRSRSPPETPYQKDGKTSRSPSPARSRSRSRSASPDAR